MQRVPAGAFVSGAALMNDELATHFAGVPEVPRSLVLTVGATDANQRIA